MTKAEITKKLIALRDNLAGKTKLEPYKILQYRTINEIAVKQPRNSEELLAVKGIGEKKLAQFGEQILAIVSSEGDQGNAEDPKSVQSSTGNTTTDVPLAGRIFT